MPQQNQCENNSIKRTGGRTKSFHFRYLELCRSKNFPPQSEIKSKCNENQNLEFFGDKYKIDDWLLISESLQCDQVLTHISIRLRKNHGRVLENIDSESKARISQNKPSIFTKFIFLKFIEAIADCVTINKNLTSLALEGLPLIDKYNHYIANALPKSESLKSLSFFRSSIGNKGCEILCNVIKCLPNIEQINMGNCQLSSEGALHISNMIKFQKIARFSEGWKQSLRYRDVEADSLQGLKIILIPQNPSIGDDGLQLITEILKEDAWIKIIDMEDCGLTNIGAELILDCLKINRSIVDFSIRGNPQISESLLRTINHHLGKDYQNNSEQLQKYKTRTVAQLQERIKLLEQQLVTEKSLRRQVDILNEKLHEQLKASQQASTETNRFEVPEGYTLVKQEDWDEIVKERNELLNTVEILRPHHDLPRIRRVKSEINASKLFKHYEGKKYSKSEHGILRKSPQKNNAGTERIYFETDIGDTKPDTHRVVNFIETNEMLNLNEYESKNPSSRHYPSKESLMVVEELKVFVKKKITENEESEFQHMKNSAKALFVGT